MRGDSRTEAEMPGKKDRRHEQRPVSVERRNRQDRRHATRVPVDIEVDYQCEGTYLFSFITDLGALGVFLRTNNPYVVGTRLNVSFKPPGEALELQVAGEVRWISPFRSGGFQTPAEPGMGVAFVDLTDEQRARLLALVERVAYLRVDGSPVATGGSGDDT
jgi:uncharacterized protein (TIGR02266 family)